MQVDIKDIKSLADTDTSEWLQEYHKLYVLNTIVNKENERDSEFWWNCGFFLWVFTSSNLPIRLLVLIIFVRSYPHYRIT